MKVLTLLFFFWLSGSLFAEEAKIEINPTKPVVGESFQAFFRIFTDSSDEPLITFSPFNLEVIGKSNQGISTRTVYANGKLTVTREITIVYDLVAKRSGLAGLRDIRVQMGNKTIKHPMVNINILQEREEVPEVFVMADVSNKSVYLGQGILVRYYLYSKVPVNNLDVKKYPKLNNFLKRFLQEPDRSERVSVDGQLFLRSQIYGAKLFPEKIGELKIDPLYLSATYMKGGNHDPFGSFGMSGRMTKRTVSSEPVVIEVKPLPETGKTPEFTGLVGKHEFDLRIRNSRLIVNEPLEVKLTVSGGGALENLEAPKILSHPGLEEFESNGDLKIMNSDLATKVFDYTYLAKENMQLPARELTVTYFDPEKAKYVPVKLSIPEIVVAGGVAAPDKVDRESPAPAVAGPSEKKEEPQPKVLAEPVLFEAASWKKWLPLANLSLGVLAIVLALVWFIKKPNLSLHSSRHIPAAFKKDRFELGEFSRWLSPLILKTGKTPLTIIKEAQLSEESKRYFIDLLNGHDYKNYSTKGSESPYIYRSKHFKELGRYIESAKHENPSSPA
jgi:hypothetical protein